MRKARAPHVRRIVAEEQRPHQAKLSKMGGDGGGGGGGFRARVEHYLYSGEKKHVLAGIAIISVLFGAPWYLMTRGTKHQSHQDYMEKADKARSERLSSAKSSLK